MKPFTLSFAITLVLCLVSFGGCAANKSPYVADNIRKSLDQAGLADVSVSQDRDKGVVTLTGHVRANSDKQRAETIARSAAAGQVVADEIAVEPPHAQSEASTVNSDLDKAIDNNLDAALTRDRMKTGVSYKVKNGVVTLTGNVNSEARRTQIEKIASSVPNVRQVVNELDVRHRKATSSTGS